MPSYAPLASDENRIMNAVTLSTTYQASGNTNVSIDARALGNICVLVVYDEGASETSNICEVEVSFSADNTNFAQFGVWADGGSGQMDYTPEFYNVDQGEYSIIAFNEDTIQARWMRVRLKEEGVASNAGTATVYVYSKGHL